MKAHRVLIVEDDPSLLRGVSDNFAARGYHVETAADGERGLDKARKLRFDLMILDVMLPRINGYEICRYLRHEGMGLPIIFLTAKSDESDVLLGLGLGADDYLRKPFGIRELLARAEAVMRRHQSGQGGSDGKGHPIGERDEEEFRFGDFVLDRRSHGLRRAGTGGRPIPLSPKEYALLSCFASHPGRALSRDDIMDEVWGYDSRVTSRTIDRFVTTLRRKIEPDPAHPRHIETIREFGYRFRE
ncbi:MAG: response regulator transcription factor [Verrucomicrobiae bacterium]|nr:response regulator transcription factor [Verrucomicrobiae bacterium]